MGDEAFSLRLRKSLLLALDKGIRGATSPAVRRALRGTRAAVSGDSLNTALREVDRAWRREPDDAAILAPIYGRLLFLEGREYEAALGMLQHNAAVLPDPDTAALSALTLLRLKRPAEARRQLETALSTYCVTPESLLEAFAAGEITAHLGMALPGWMGRGPDLGVVGEVAASEISGSLDVSSGRALDFTWLVPTTRSAKRRAFQIKLPDSDTNPAVGIHIRGVALLGSGQRLPRDFGLDGRSYVKERSVGGWAQLGWAPDSTVTLRVTDSGGHSSKVLARKPLPRQWSFLESMKSLGLKGDRFEISAQLPDGRWQPLPDSPLLLQPALRLPKSRAAALAAWQPGPALPRKRTPTRPRPVDIIIPMYRGHEESIACLESVLATITGTAKVVVIDDATDEPALAAALDAYAADQRIVLLLNKENLGFVASVNSGIALHKNRDVVLLNSDTRVFGDWLERLQRAAYISDKVGTVTPLSNNGTIASYPQPLGAAIDPAAAADLQTLAAAAHDGVGADIPVGVGFCLYMRRDCIAEVGALDAAVFGKGYGEESDFCLRARARGWRHRLAADVYVYHAGGSSFGSRRAALLERSQRLLDLRHPGYARFIASFLAQDPLRRLRRRLDEQRLLGFREGFVLVVTLALPGGVDRYVAERGRQLRQWGLHMLVLRPSEVGNSHRCELTLDALELPNLRYDVPGELPELSSLLKAIGLKGIEIQHFLGLDARVIEAIRALPVPYDVMVHDYAWICPRVTLIDGSGRYCGEPAVSVCQACVRRLGSHLQEKITVPALRTRSDTWLRGARRVLAPSVDAAERLRRHFTDLMVNVQPHSLPYTAVPHPPAPVKGRRLRVAVLGAIGHHKGYRVLLDCARDARARALPIEFVVIGFTENDAPLLATGRIFVTGRYSDGEVRHLFERERPDLTWLPSVWPETWCYALDHVLRTGLPVVAFDIGALGERLRNVAGAELLPLSMSPGPINDRLLAHADKPQAAVERLFR